MISAGPKVLAQVVDRLPDAIVLSTAVRGAAGRPVDLRVASLNAAARARHPLAESAIGRHWGDVWPQVADGGLLRACLRALESGVAARGEMRWLEGSGFAAGRYEWDAVALDSETLMWVLRDIGARPPAAADDRLAAAFGQAPIGMAIIDLEGVWLRVNGALCALLGYPEEILLTKRLQDITHPDDLEVDRRHIRRLLAGKIQDYRLEKRYVRANGSVIWVLLAVGLIRDAGGVPTSFVVHVQDVSERKREGERLLRLADHDALTGLYNRRRLEEEAQRQILMIQRYGGMSALLAVDLDHFKLVNDTHGHSAGDAVLRAVASALRRASRKTDIVARIGGDEFAVVLLSVGEAEAERIARQVEERIGRQVVRLGATRVSTQASVGVAMVTPESRSYTDVMAHADAAMYARKAARREEELSPNVNVPRSGVPAGP